MNFAPYDFTIDRTQNPPWHMDERHISMLHDAIIKSGAETAIEIGSHRGASTSAFVEALNSGDLEHLTCIEPHATPELHRVLAKVSRGTARIVSKYSTDFDFTGPRPDFVLIDGNHDWPAIWEVAMCLAWGVPTIAMHDTQGHYGCTGSMMAARALRVATGRKFTEDCEARVGEFTHRGLLISSVVQDSIFIGTLDDGEGEPE